MALPSAVSVASKLPDIGTTIFSVIGALVEQYKPINLSQGAPNFKVSPQLIDGATLAMRNGFNQYSPADGIATLRELLSAKVANLYARHYDPREEITITGSASEGLYAAITALIHSGDEVIYFEPAFDSYVPNVRLQGGKPVPIQLKAPDFALPWDELSAAINSKTKMIIINSPHNPTARVLSAEDLDKLAALTANTNIVILSDEVYEHIIFDGVKHMSMACHPQLAERSVIVSSFGKTFHVTGWRVGYCLAPKEIMAEVRKVHQFLMYAADTPFQHAVADYMQDPQTYLGLAEFYQHKRDLLLDALAATQFKLYPSQGSFFMLAGYEAFTDEADKDLVLRLIRDYHVATIPLSAFYSDGYDPKILRLSFAKDDETLRQGAAALIQFSKDNE
ncbi:2-keto-4-methylthiobutyrate aminotransferase [Celerinatantimonas diazotrophica]|uniref:2-keto-4-methylthiobutyrate aminotransferase n=1 Tax=Celerinatantimonas diazotrophica TaxID=412034 RepID=A0A4R1J881_9GAMM|nr:2-keto-4-methylthiobutyrate aminotransferase [Celerinatantimonas diazotrophica]CAG9295418.1 Methionine aminotransferase [Celerinatantimonas diazotrophica]